MRENKNMLKPNNRVENKMVGNKNFYAVIEVVVKNKAKGTSTTKSYVHSFKGERIHAKNHLERVARKTGGKIVYFGAFN